MSNSSSVLVSGPSTPVGKFRKVSWKLAQDFQKNIAEHTNLLPTPSDRQARRASGPALGLPLAERAATSAHAPSPPPGPGPRRAAHGQHCPCSGRASFFWARYSWLQCGPLTVRPTLQHFRLARGCFRPMVPPLLVHWFWVKCHAPS